MFVFIDSLYKHIFCIVINSDHFLEIHITHTKITNYNDNNASVHTDEQ